MVQIHAGDLNKPSKQAIEDNINAKYSNKVSYEIYILDVEFITNIFMQVIQKVGLCISLYDLLSASEGLIGHGTGIVNVNGMDA